MQVTQFIFLRYECLNPLSIIVSQELFGFQKDDVCAFLPDEDNVLSDEPYPALMVFNDRVMKALNTLSYAAKQYLMGNSFSQAGQQISFLDRESIGQLFHFTQGYLKALEKQTGQKNDDFYL